MTNRIEGATLDQERALYHLQTQKSIPAHFPDRLTENPP